MTNTATRGDNYADFDKDAIVLKHVDVDTVRLQPNETSRSLTVQVTGFPYLGIWTKRNAPFLCIEPWFGLADYVDHQQDIFAKEGILVLAPDEQFSCAYSFIINH